MSEQLTLRPNVPITHCSMCFREHGDDTQRFVVDFEQGGMVGKASICRWCIAEHAPGLLEELEAP